MNEIIQQVCKDHLHFVQRFIFSQSDVIEKSARMMIDALREKHKLLIFGNGGSAADSQHFAAELVVRFKKDRPAIPAIALSTDTSILTSIGNDFTFDEVFSRQVEALAAPGDICVGISTSGNSRNVLKAVEIAKAKGITTVGFTGENGGNLKDLCDLCLQAPADTTDRIQECHELAIHIICDLIEQTLFED